MRRPLVVALLAACAAPIDAQTVKARPVPHGLTAPTLVSTEWLAARLSDPDVVVLHVGHGDDFLHGHIPGARAVTYGDIVIERDGVSTELPPVEQLRQTFEKLGVSDRSHVVIYAHDGRMAPMASRVFLTLDHLGLERISLLDGGLGKWRAEGRAIGVTARAVAPGRLTPRPREVTVDAKWMSSRAGAKGVSYIDTRTTPEYVGNGTRGGLPSKGHIARARQLEWEQLFASVERGTFLDSTSMARLFAERVAPGDTVVTYCLVGYRASMTYFAARMLGYPVRLYDGSYQEWARLGFPVIQGSAP